MRSFTSLAIAALFICACGGSNENNQSDAAPQDDAARQWDTNRPQDSTPQPDGPVTCLVTEDFGALGALDGFMADGADPTDSAVYYVALNSDTKPDVLWIELFNGFGVFTDGIVPGTYQLTGDELNYATCGACVDITADYDMTAGTWKQDYMATGGTLTITEVTPRLIGTLTNVTFGRADIDGTTGETTLTGDCPSALTSGSFDTWLAATATFKIIGLTDLHGQLNPFFGKGGAAQLAALIDSERNSCTLVVGAGDMIGASEPLSSFFAEETTIKALNLMGLDATTLGNHEFDKGLTALESLISLAEFDYVSSNLTNLSTNLPGVEAPYVIYDFLGIKVAVIGITDVDLAAVTLPANLGTLTVTPTVAEAATQAQAARTAAQTAGATVFIAMVHLGATSATEGELFTFASAVTGFDVIVGGHSHYTDLNTTSGTTVLVQPANKGQSYARISLSVSTETGAVSTRTGEIVPAVLPDGGTPDPEVVAMLDPYRTQLAPILDAVIGVASASFPRDGAAERTAEAALGDLVADALRDKYSTQLAYVCAGVLSAPLPSTYAPVSTALRRPATGYAAGPPWDLVKGDVYALLPYGNVAVTRTVTGTQLWEMLENGFSLIETVKGRFPQISGFKVEYDPDGTVGARVVSVKLPDDTPILKDSTTYTLATYDFINLGGDGYTMLNDGAGVQQDLLAEVVAAYITAQSPITPATLGTRLIPQ